MKIILTTGSEQAAETLKNKIINVIMGKDRNDTIETWSYTQAQDGSDIIYHNKDQYVNDPTKNVIFIVKVNEVEVTFKDSYWRNTKNIRPIQEMVCYHTGRLTEILLAHFGSRFSSFEIEQ